MKFGKPLFLQTRMGKNKNHFTIYKFRTLPVETPENIPTHELQKIIFHDNITRILRLSKLDEIPQLINILKGEMSFIGPRPNLLNQFNVIEARNSLGIYSVLPGLTGLSQIQGIDMSEPKKLAKTDFAMIQKWKINDYPKYLIHTLFINGFK